MSALSVPAPLPEDVAALDGAARQRVASGVWNAWRSDGVAAALITGMSGAGKSDRLVRPLIARAARAGAACVQVDAPVMSEATDLDFELLSQLISEAESVADARQLLELRSAPSFASAARLLLRWGTLVVIDEFQRLLDREQRPIEPFGTQLAKLARRVPDDGCLWLVSNQLVEGVWAEPFYAAQLEAPGEQDAVRIVLANLDQEQHEGRLPSPRRTEVVRRLGANPRVLRLLGYLLRSYDLDELVGPAGELPPAMPFAPVFVEDTERSLLAKAESGLSDQSRQLLTRLSILNGWAVWELIEAMGGELTDVRSLVDELRQHYLLEARHRKYRVHPVVRETRGARFRSDASGWAEANRMAGEWFGHRTVELVQVGVADARLAPVLAGALSHLAEVRASSVLVDTLTAASQYIERRYGWTSAAPATSFERDARIALLEAYTSRGGSPAVHFQLAKLLRQRGRHEDLEAALTFAHKATIDQDFSDPWTLRVQLAREAMGDEAGIAAAEEAVGHVAPSKSLFALYQVLGACLTSAGRPREAVERLIEGADRCDGNQYRLVEEAILRVTAEADRASFDALLTSVNWPEFAPQRALADVLTHEGRDDWHSAAELAAAARVAEPKYLHLAMHEALSWLGAGQPDRAQESLDRFPLPLNANEGSAATWVLAFVALERGDLASASHFTQRFFGRQAGAEAAEAIRQALLEAWDSVPQVMAPTPAVVFPLLPSSMTGEPGVVRRPLYSGSVLRKDKTDIGTNTRKRRPAVLSLATEWQSARGGLSSLNRQLCAALAAVRAEVICVVPSSTHADRMAASAVGVTLLDAPDSPGANELMRLGREPDLPAGFNPDLVIGHGRVTGPAAQAVTEDSFPSARRLHVVHIAPDEIEWEKPDRLDDAGERAERRTALELALATSADAVVAVGPLLYERYLTELSGLQAPPPLLRLDPGFDVVGTDREPPPGSPWRVLVLGRMEDARLKGLDTAAKAVGRAVRARGPAATAVELIVRGAPAGSSEELRNQIIEWADAPSLRVVVRPYSTASEQLEADLRRATLVLLPSRSEGFGLVGLEAIVTGTPVLLSNRSGVGMLLQELLEIDEAMRFVLPVDVREDELKAAWSTAVQAVLLDRESAFARAGELGSRLARAKRWQLAAEGLLRFLQLDA